MPTQSFCYPLVLTSTLFLTQIAPAKGPSVTLADAVTGIEFAWNSVRPGETLPVRVSLDIAAACGAPDAMWYPGATEDGCPSTAASCTEALEEARWRHGLTLTLGWDGGDFEIPMSLEGCSTASGPSLCGEVVFPRFAPSGVWDEVRAPGSGEPLFVLGKASVHLESEESDLERPTLRSVSMPAGAAPPSAPGIEVVVADDVSGVVEVDAWLEPLGSDGKPSDGKVLHTVLRCDAPDATGEAVCRGTRPLHDRGWLNAVGDDWGPVPGDGRWYLRSLQFRDRLGRYGYWEPPELARGGAAGLGNYALTVSYAAGTVATWTTAWARAEQAPVATGALSEPGEPVTSRRPGGTGDEADDSTATGNDAAARSAGCSTGGRGATPVAFVLVLGLIWRAFLPPRRAVVSRYRRL